jgi:hypothetical protein
LKVRRRCYKLFSGAWNVLFPSATARSRHYSHLQCLFSPHPPPLPSLSLPILLPPHADIYSTFIMFAFFLLLSIAAAAKMDFSRLRGPPIVDTLLPPSSSSSAAPAAADADSSGNGNDGSPIITSADLQANMTSGELGGGAEGAEQGQQQPSHHQPLLLFSSSSSPSPSPSPTTGREASPEAVGAEAEAALTANSLVKRARGPGVTAATAAAAAAGELTPPHRPSADPSPSLATPSPSPAPTAPSWRSLLSHPRALLLLVLACLWGFGSGVYDNYLFLYLDELHAPPAVMGLSLTLNTVAEVRFFSPSISLNFFALGTQELVCFFFFFSHFSFLRKP